MRGSSGSSGSSSKQEAQTGAATFCGGKDKNKITSVYFWNMRSSLIKVLGALRLSVSRKKDVQIESERVSQKEREQGKERKRVEVRLRAREHNILQDTRCGSLFAAFRIFWHSVCKRRATRTVDKNPLKIYYISLYSTVLSLSQSQLTFLVCVAVEHFVCV